MVKGTLKYGVHKLGKETTLREESGNVELVFKKIDGNIYHYFRRAVSDEVEKTLIISKGEVGIYPTTPNIVNPEYSEYVYVKLTRKIVIEEKGEAEVFIKAPIGVALALNANKMFDGFTLNEKHALYGTLVRGVLARYYVSDIYFRKPETMMFGEALVKVKIANENDEVSEVDKVVFPATGLPIYYSEKSCEAFYPNVTMKIVDYGIAEIMVSEEKPFNNLRVSPIKIGSLKKMFTMEWGV